MNKLPSYFPKKFSAKFLLRLGAAVAISLNAGCITINQYQSPENPSTHSISSPNIQPENSPIHPSNETTI